jgi:hypothetical protein
MIRKKQGEPKNQEFPENRGKGAAGTDRRREGPKRAALWFTSLFIV